MKRFYLSLLVLCFVVLSCKQNTDTTRRIVSEENYAVTSISDSNVFNFWNNFNYSSSRLFDNDYAEQRLVDFISLLPFASKDDVDKAIKNMLSEVKPFGDETFSFFVDQYRHYLFDPNSPYRNNSYYESVLEYLLDSTELNRSELQDIERDILLVRSNPIGEIASDFSYLSSGGHQRTMCEMVSDYTILLFYDPGCSHCDEVIEDLKKDKYLNRLLKTDSLLLLAIYPFGEYDLWRSYQKNIPESWNNGFDQNLTIIKQNLYDLRATPSLFLLNEGKSVILRDADLSTLKKYLEDLHET